MTHVIKEFAEFGGPSDLHDAWGDDQSFVVPNALIDLESATHTFEWRGIAARL